MNRRKFALRQRPVKALPVKTTLAAVVATGLVVLALGALWNQVTGELDHTDPPAAASLRSGPMNIESTRRELLELASALSATDNKADVQLLGNVFASTWTIAQEITQDAAALQKGTSLYHCSLAVDAVFRGVKAMEAGEQWNDQQFRAAIAGCQ
jgi:hypothetical protein